MLLTLSQPSRNDFSLRSSHDFSRPPPYPSHHYSPKPSPNPQLPATEPIAPMSTSHRGLPPPAAMTLPDPGRPPPPPPQLHSQPLGAMPAPPNQWQGAEDSMRNWLNTKAEEERRKQEEERTRQETLRLEQRRVEQSMLRESMQGGVPPQMIPMIFAGIGGSNLVNASLEWLQQYAAQLQATQQQLQGLDVSPEARRERESRMINNPPPQSHYGPAQTSQTAPVPPPPLAQHQTTFPAYTTSSAPLSPQSRSRNLHGAPTSAPRSAAHSALPRLTTNEMSVHPPQQTAAPGSAHPVHQNEQPSSSPSIYFHHWVPPSQDSKPNPPTPSGRNEPGSAHPSHEGEFRDSPRKRKAVGEHRPTPAPSQTSPSFSVTSKSGKNSYSSNHSHSQSQSQSHSNSNNHNRVRSNASAKESSDSARQTPSRRDSVANPRGPHHHESFRSYESTVAPGS